MVQVIIQVEKELHKKLRHKALDKELTLKEAVLEALSLWLENG